MTELPQGTVTLVFTDIEGSTRLLASLGSRYEDVLSAHRRLVREAFSSHGGIEVDTQGDAFFFALHRAGDAVTGAVAAQRALASHDFGEGIELLVRMGIHTGEPTVSDEGYVGSDVHLGARICAAAWGGQIVVSSATTALGSSGLNEVTLVPLGDHALKDIDARVQLFQVVAPGLREDFPALRITGTHPTNLPARLRPLIGRDDEIASVSELLTSSDVSLVTLVGPGGTGKTSLAAAVGAEVLPALADGVFFVDLSALTDPSLVISAIAQSLSIKETPGRTLQQSLTEHLASKDMLLILDNFEQVIEAASEAPSVLMEAPSLKVLVTSREALRIQGERVFSLAPLELPPSDQNDLHNVAISAAATLFLARARAVKEDFVLTEDNAPHVAAICRRLDGLPLALELAAARINLLSPEALLARLDYGLKVLTSGRRDTAERQKTLKGAISWSHGLLSQDEQKLFCRLGVFAGGWTLKAAEVVCDRGDLSVDVIDGLASLVDKSLLRARDHEDRFAMLETIRSFARERLDQSDMSQEMARAHAEYFRALAQEAEPHLVGADQKEWLDKLEGEHDNLRAMFRWSLAADASLSIAAAAHVSRFWYLRGYLSEGRTWLELALAASGGEATGPTVKIVSMLAVIAYVQGDLDSARSLATRGVTLAQALHDERGVMRCTETLAACEMEQGGFAEARTYFEGNLGRARALQDERGVAVSTGNLSLLALLEGDHESASAMASESLALHRKFGDKEGMAAAGNTMGFNALLSNDLQGAKLYLLEAFRTAADVGYKELIGSALEGLAATAAQTGEFELGAILLGAAGRIGQESGIALEPIEQEVHERATDSLLVSLKKQRFDLLLAKGASMSVDDVLQYIHV